jgi:hypothetical protein
MPVGDGWYLFGPLIVVVLVGALCWVLGLIWADVRDDAPIGLAIFIEREDYGLLSPAAITDEPDVADEIRLVLAAAGIRTTQAARRDGRVAVLVFAEELDEARRLVGDTPAL